MITLYFQAPGVLHRLRSGPAGAHLDGFAQYLHDLGYARRTAKHHLLSAAHLAVWEDRRDHNLPELSDDSLLEFRRHLGSCTCLLRGRGEAGHVVAGACLFLDYLRRIGVVAPSCASSNGDDEPELVQAFGQWMLRHRGVTLSTLQVYGRVLRRFLQTLGDNPARFTAAGLREFVLEFASCYSRHHAKVAVTAVRMFLRYLAVEGQCAAGLDAAVPTVAEWRLSALPCYLPASDVERIVAACGLSTPVGVRDRAVVLLLWRLGLRAGEVAALRFQDFDWQRASVRIAGKGRRETCLPLPQDAGDAVLDYLERGRQPFDDDHVFLRAIAPWGPLKRYGVSDIVDRAIRRAAVSAPSHGAHLLRHSAATEMLRQGSSLQGVAAVLRHRSLETTTHYAKVDVTMLREIAQPWPEVLPC
jgi:site-specific recombinase XerD